MRVLAFLCVAFLLSCVPSSQGDAAGLRGQNLLCDPSGEDVTSSCWTAPRGGPPARVNGSLYPQGALDGSFVLSAPYSFSSGSSISQNVTVAVYPVGTTFLFTAFLSSINFEAEMGRVLLQWLDGSDSVILNVSSPLWPSGFPEADAQRWYRYTTSLTKPVGASRLRVNLLTLADSPVPQMFYDALHLAAGNMLLNPSGEYIAGAINPTLDSWTAIASPAAASGTYATPWSRLSQYRSLTPQTGRYFFVPPATTSEAYLYQDVSVADFPTGMPFFLEVYTAAAVAGTSSDVTAVILQWRAANNTVLANDTLPDQSFSSLAWVVRRLLPVKRSGATVCRVLLASKRRRWIQDGYNNRGFFDSLFFGPADEHATFNTVDLTLGAVHTSDSGRRAITIVNTGVFNSLSVLAVSLSQPSGSTGLSLTGANASDIPPLGNQTWWLLIDTTTSATWTGSLTFSLNDPLLTEVIIPVSCTIYTATIIISPTSLDFGTLHVSAADQTLYIYLIGGGDPSVTVYGVETNFSTAFQMVGAPSSSTTLAAGVQASFAVSFQPSIASPGLNAAAIFIVTSDISKANVTIPVQAVVEDYFPTLSPATLLDFGQRHILLGPKTLQVHLNNTGTWGVLQVLSVELQSTGNDLDLAQFSLDSTRPRNLRPGVAATWTITFTPNAAGVAYGYASCNLNLVMNYAPNPNVNVLLTATGSDQSIYANPASVLFRSSHIYGGPSSSQQTLDIGAAGTQGTLTVQNLSLVGLGGRNASFALTSDPPQNPIQVGSFAAISLKFNPGLDAGGAPGWRNDTLLVGSDDPVTPVLAVPLAALALDYAIALQMSAFNFGEQHIANSAAAVSFHVRNTGTLGSLKLSSSTTSPSTSGFSVSMPNVQVPAGSYVNLTLYFQPASVGQKNGTLTVLSDDPVNPSVECNLTGLGIDPQPLLAGGEVAVIFPDEQDTDAPPSAPLPVLLNNTGTFGNMVVAASAITGDAAYNFQIVSADGSPLAPGSSRQWAVRFTPNETGTLGATLMLWTQTGQEARVELIGNAVHPKVALSTTAVNFGQWDILAGIRTFSDSGLSYFELVVYNVGLTGLLVKSHRILVNPGGSYSLVNSLEGTVIDAGSQVVLQVAWDPANPNGLQQGLLSITTNDYLKPVINVTLKGQAIEQLGVNSSIIGNVSFQPPFAGHASTVRIFVYTADAGLEMDGAIQATLPDGFNLSDATATIGQTYFGRNRLQINGTQVTISVAGSGLASIQKGGLIKLFLHNVVLPTYAACQASYADWRWTVTTYDAQGGLLEFAFDADLPGVVCVAPKTFNMTTTPALPAAPEGLQSGFHVQFTIVVQEAESLLAVGAPLLDTRPGRDMVKTIAAFKDGFPQYCSDGAAPEGGLISESDNLGDLDAVAQLNATFRTTFLLGTWRLCYRQAFRGFGWEQVGEPFFVSDKIPNYVALDWPIPMPPSMQIGVADWWANGQPWDAEDNVVRVGDVEPLRVVVNDTVRYRFSGAFFNGGRSLRAKVAYQVRGCGGTAPGTPAEGVALQSNLAYFAVAEPSLYTICIQERAPYWFPLEDLWVRTVEDADPPATDRPAFSGFQSCGEYSRHFPSRCGCFYGGGALANATEDDTLGVNFLLGAVSGNQTINQGCCAAGNPRMLVKTDDPKWGYCTTS